MDLCSESSFCRRFFHLCSNCYSNFTKIIMKPQNSCWCYYKHLLCSECEKIYDIEQKRKRDSDNTNNEIKNSQHTTSVTVLDVSTTESEKALCNKRNQTTNEQTMQPPKLKLVLQEAPQNMHPNSVKAILKQTTNNNKNLLKIPFAKKNKDRNAKKKTRRKTHEERSTNKETQRTKKFKRKYSSILKENGLINLQARSLQHQQIHDNVCKITLSSLPGEEVFHVHSADVNCSRPMFCFPNICFRCREAIQLSQQFKRTQFKQKIQSIDSCIRNNFFSGKFMRSKKKRV